MADVAQLGLAVDSSQIIPAVSRVKELGTSAQTTAKQVDGLSDASKRSETQQRAMEASAKRLGVSVAEVEARTKATNGAINQHVEKLTLSERASASAARAAGTLTDGLSRLHPVFGFLGGGALTLTAIIGGLAIGYKQLQDAAMALADRAGKLQDFAETTGFTVIQLQALEKAGAQVGVSANSVSMGLEKFSVAMDDARKGVGPVYESILELDKGLAKQLTTVKTLSGAYDLVSKAIKGADLEQANKLSRALFGRGGVELSRLSRSSADAGGVDGLVKGLNDLDIITKKQAADWDALGDNINEKMKAAKQNIASIITEAVLTSMDRFSTGFLSFTQEMKSFTMSEDFKSFIAWTKSPTGMAILGALGGAALGGITGGPLGALAGGLGMGGIGLAKGLNDRPAQRVVINGGETLPAQLGGSASGADERARLQDLENQKKALGEIIAAQERYNAVAGAGVTPAQNLKLGQDKLKLAFLENKITTEQLATAQGGLNAQYSSTQFATYIGLLGQSVSVEEQVRAKRNAINDAARQGVRLTQEQIDTQIRLVRENALGITQMQAQIEAEKVRAATLGMSREAALAYEVAQSQINAAIAKGAPYNEQEMAQIRAKAAEYAKVKVQTDLVADSLRAMDQIQRDAFGDFLQNMRQGKSVADSLAAAFGSMADKLAKIGGDKLFDSLKSGTLFGGNDISKSGIVEGFEAIQKKAADARANPNNSFSFNSPGGAAATGVASVAAGIGIYGQSKQQGAAGGSLASGALSGALTGAMAGFALGGPIGGVIGGIGGAIAGLFGASDGARQAANQARDAWTAVKPAALDFARVLAGGGNGSLAQSFSQAASQAQQFVDTALKANDTESVNKVWAGYYEFIARGAREFRQSFGGIVDALNSGLGTNSPFASAAANVKSVGDSLKGFVDDTRKAFASDPVRDQVAGSDTTAAAAEQVAQATAAAQKYLLSLLGQAPVLSDVAQAIQHLSGTATQLQTTLVELGMSSEQAAQALSSGVTAAMAQLAATFTNGLEREINDALGQGYLNSTADLIARRTTALADAAALGTGSQLVDRWFSVQAQKLVDDAKLTGDAFAALTARFPQLQGVVHAFLDTTAAAVGAKEQINYQQAALAQLSAAQSEYTSAQGGLTSAYQSQANLIKGIATAAQQAADSLKKFRESLLINKSYTNLDPQQQYLEAQRQFRSVSMLAAGGDADALGKLQDVSTAYLDASKSYYASSEAYFNDFAEVQGILASSEIAALAQVDVATAQLNALNQQVSGLVGIKDVITMGDANTASTIAAGNAAIVAAIAALASAQANVMAAQANISSTQDYGVRPLVNQAIQAGLNAAGINFTGNYGPNGNFGQFVASQTQSVQDQIRAISNSVPTGLVDMYALQGHYASGTDFARGGLSMVGERGPEIMNVPRGAQIIPNDIMRGMQRSSNDNASSNGISRADLESLGRMIVDALGGNQGQLTRILEVLEAAPDKTATANRRTIDQNKKRA